MSSRTSWVASRRRREASLARPASRCLELWDIVSTSESDQRIPTLCDLIVAFDQNAWLQMKLKLKVNK